MLNMDFANLIKLISDNQSPKEETPKNEESKKEPQADDTLASLMPLVLKNSGGKDMQNILPLLAMMQGGKVDHTKLLTHFMKQKEAVKPTPPEKSIFDSYKRVE